MPDRACVTPFAPGMAAPQPKLKTTWETAGACPEKPNRVSRARMERDPEAHEKRRPLTGEAPPVRSLGPGRAWPQKPALIFSKAADCFSRSSPGIGNWASTGTSIGPSPIAVSASFPIAAIALAFAWP